jgi:Kef-type K+ transport system membrane component KefB
MVDYELSRLLLSLVLLLSTALAVGHIFHHFNLPRVIGEILAGIILGPSFFGFISPEMFNWVFNGFDDQSKLLSVFYWLGLILLMFSAGFDLPEKVEKGDGVLLISLFLGGLTLPLAAGFFIANVIPNAMNANEIAFTIVIAVASAVTSIPVLSRIFIDLDMISSRFAKMILTAAAAQDLVLWVILSIALAIQIESTSSLIPVTGHIKIIINTIFFVIFSIYMGPIILRLSNSLLKNKNYQLPLMGYTLLTCLVLATFASMLGVNVVFAALLAGVVIGQFSGDRMSLVKQNIKSFSIWFFVPIYFALVGQKLNLLHNLDLYLLLKVLLLTSLIKIIGVTLFSNFVLNSWKQSFDYGVAMNARGGPGIVLASLAYAAKIIGDELFLVLVLVSIITSLISGIWIRFRRHTLRVN